MARSRYSIIDPAQPYFLTSTVIEWLPVFTREEAVQILFDSWRYLQANQGLRLYGYVILENHLHAVLRLRIYVRPGAVLNPILPVELLTC